MAVVGYVVLAVILIFSLTYQIGFLVALQCSKGLVLPGQLGHARMEMQYRIGTASSQKLVCDIDEKIYGYFCWVLQDFKKVTHYRARDE